MPCSMQLCHILLERWHYLSQIDPNWDHTDTNNHIWGQIDTDTNNHSWGQIDPDTNNHSWGQIDADTNNHSWSQIDTNNPN